MVLVLQVVFQPQKEQPTLEQMLAKKQAENEQPSEHIKESAEERALKPYQFLLVNVLREYLALELHVQTPFPFDMERVYDDFGEEAEVVQSAFRIPGLPCGMSPADPRPNLTATEEDHRHAITGFANMLHHRASIESERIHEQGFSGYLAEL